jgi:hypothetical protein
MKALTYLIYIVLWEIFTLGGCTYLVFFRSASPWWYVLAVILSGSAYPPAQWAALFDKEQEPHNER